VFESTYSRDEPFRVKYGKGELILGVEQGLETMKEGGIRRLLIPQHLGYQDSKHGPLPQDYGMRRRLFSRLGNKSRALPTLIVIDLELIHLYNP